MNTTVDLYASNEFFEPLWEQFCNVHGESHNKDTMMYVFNIALNDRNTKPLDREAKFETFHAQFCNVYGDKHSKSTMKWFFDAGYNNQVKKNEQKDEHKEHMRIRKEKFEHEWEQFCKYYGTDHNKNAMRHFFVLGYQDQYREVLNLKETIEDMKELENG